MYRIWEQKTTDELARVLKDRKTAQQLSMAMISFLEGISLLSVIFYDSEYDWKAILKTIEKKGLEVVFRK